MPKQKTIYRDARTGLFTTKKHVERDPDRTVTEKRPVRRPKPKGK